MRIMRFSYTLVKYIFSLGQYVISSENIYEVGELLLSYMHVSNMRISRKRCVKYTTGRL